MLDLGDAITQDQITERDKLFAKACQLLSPPDEGETLINP